MKKLKKNFWLKLKKIMLCLKKLFFLTQNRFENFSWKFQKIGSIDEKLKNVWDYNWKNHEFYAS